MRTLNSDIVLDFAFWNLEFVLDFVFWNFEFVLDFVFWNLEFKTGGLFHDPVQQVWNKHEHKTHSNECFFILGTTSLKQAWLVIPKIKNAPPLVERFVFFCSP